MNTLQLRKDIDNLDHFTLLYEQGKSMDEKTAEEMIRDFSFYYPSSAECADLDNIPTDQEGIYNTLRAMRAKMFEML